MSFEDFYHHTFKGCFRFFYYKSVDFGQIEDLVQESYLRFYDKYKRKLYDAESSEEAKKILLGIALNVYREWVRRQVNQGVQLAFVEELDYEKEEGLEQLAFVEYLAEDFDSQREARKKQILIAIQDLSNNVRRVLECRFFEGLSRKATAQKLSLTEDKVHTYQKRGVKYLREILNQVPPQSLT